MVGIHGMLIYAIIFNILYFAKCKSVDFQELAGKRRSLGMERIVHGCAQVLAIWLAKNKLTVPGQFTRRKLLEFPNIQLIKRGQFAHC